MHLYKKSLQSLSASRWMLFFLWLFLIIVSGKVRPLVPSNELHYSAVAWEMWIQHSFLVPIQSGIPYPDKPPLLFWLIHLGWFVFGVNNWWPRLVPEIFALLSIFVTQAISLRLWPEKKTIGILSGFILLGSYAWCDYIPRMRFDMLLTFFSLFALYWGLRSRWFLSGIFIGFGILAKGPVVFLFVLVPWLLFLYCTVKQERAHYYLHLLYAVVIGIAIGFCWALPAAHFGGPQFANAIFFNQSLGRVVGAYGSTPFYYYLKILPAFMFPFFLWKYSWMSLKNIVSDDPRIKFVGLSSVVLLFIFSLIDQKGLRYLLPWMPLVAILMSALYACAESQYKPQRLVTLGCVFVFLGICVLCSPLYIVYIMHKNFWLPEVSQYWGVLLLVLGCLYLTVKFTDYKKVIVTLSVTTTLVIIVGLFAVVRIQARYNDWTSLAKKAAILQKSGPVASVNSEVLFGFIGRFKKPEILIKPANVRIWSQKYPNGWIIIKDHSVSPSQYSLIRANSFH